MKFLSLLVSVLAVSVVSAGLLDKARDLLKKKDIGSLLDNDDIQGVIDKVGGVVEETKNTLKKAAAFRKKLHADVKGKFNDFVGFIAQFNKTYSDDEDLNDRFSKFQASLKRIQKRQNESSGAVFGVTPFSDLSPEEFLSKLTGVKGGDHVAELHSTATPLNDSDARVKRAAASSFDWRNKNGVTAVKNQGGCGSCYAFAAVAALESLYAIKKGQTLDLSEQQAISCAKGNSKYYSNGCNGGSSPGVIQWIIDNGGIGKESDFAYVSGSNANNVPGCKSISKVAQVGGYSSLAQNNENNIRDQLYANAPVITYIDASPLQDYKSGIINKQGNGVNHGVLIVGYGNANGVDYWSVKNSWSASWGESGFFRVKRNVNALNIAQYNYLARL